MPFVIVTNQQTLFPTSTLCNHSLALQAKIKMYRLVSIFYLLWFITGCSGKEWQQNSKDSTSTSSASNINDSTNKYKAIPNIGGCYMRVLQRDTLAASLQQNGEIVTGKLTFDNYQKDGSTGTVKGKVQNNILKFIYRFQSEGMNSVMEVYFKIEEDGLVHGYGEVGVKRDSAYYSDTANIKYPEADKLKKLACSELPAKYQ